MTRIHEQIETRLPVQAAFDYVADFSNAPTWDPGTETSERLDGGPVGEGSRYRLGVHIGPRVRPMEYRITVHDAPRQVVLVGTGSGVTSTDDIRFEPLPSGGTRVDYRADIELGGLMGLVQPLFGSVFAKIGRNAAAGMRRALDEQAARAGTKTP
jgi:carbon monoxide dehydrogenase subunit G